MTFSILFFTACGNKYNNLELSFYLNNSETDKLELVLDEDKEYSSQDIKIKIDGLKKDDVGQLIVYSAQEGMVTVSNYRYLENSCVVKIAASKVGDSKLIAKHLSSNKEKSIDLSILRKSKNLTVSNSKYVVAIPEEEQKSIYFEAKDIVNLSPYGSSDKIVFKTFGTIPNNVEPIYYLKNGRPTEYIVGLVVKSSVVENSKLKLHPTTILESENYSYDFKTYENQEIEVDFIKPLNESNLVLTTSDLRFNYQVDGKTINYVENNETIHLLYNDGVNNLNSLVVEFGGSVDTVLDYYTVNPISSDRTITLTKLTNKQFLIQADGKSSQISKIDFNFQPKNCVGEISSFTKTIKIVGEAKPDYINVFMPKGQNPKTPLDLNETIEIYDYYASGDTRGAMFSFKPASYDGASVYSDLAYMQLVVSPKIVNLVSTDIYTDIKFDTKCSSVPSINSSKFSLDLYLGSNKMRFYYDSATDCLYSEYFNQLSSVYIKYVENSEKTEEQPLTLNVKTCYNLKGTLNYLKEVQPISAEINFKKQKGITDVDLVVGVMDDTLLQQIGDLEVLNIDKNKTDLGENKEFEIQLNSVKDVNGNILINSNIALSFVVTPLDGQENNILKLNVGSVVGNDVVLNYNGGTSYIGFDYDSNTAVGNYRIDILQKGSGFVYDKPIMVHIYKRITTEDFEGYQLGQGDYFYNVKGLSGGEKQYLYEDYKADYIVSASNEEISFNLKLSSDLIDSQMIDSYTYGYEIIEQDSDPVSVLNDLSYFSFESNNRDAKLKFKKGTSLNGNVYIINFTVLVNTTAYEVDESNVLKKINQNGKLVLSFYVYEKITDDMLTINHTQATKYIYDYLGVYNLDDSKLNLTLGLKNDNLWQYVQTYNDNKFVDWCTNDSNGWNVIKVDNGGNLVPYVERELNEDGTDVDLTFRSYASDYYTVKVTGYIKQFGVIYSRSCVVEVKKPTITDRVIITSQTYESTSSENRYINLKVGEKYKIEAECVSNNNETITNPDITFVVVKNKSRAQDVILVSSQPDEINTIIVDHADTNIQIIVFALDALLFKTEAIYNYSNVSSMLINSSAYCVIDVYISNGTETNPYLINSASDFVNMKNETQNGAYYMLMRDIDLTGNKVSFNSFKINLTTPKMKVQVGSEYENYNYIYTISGITLTNNYSKLFDVVDIFDDDINGQQSGSITGIKFVVNYQYDLSTVSSDYYLGIVGRNYGKITNCSVVIVEGSEISYTYNTLSVGNSNTYFGGLVGENRGIINYTNKTVSTINGVEGSLILTGNAKNLFIGGIVGRNIGEINGNYKILAEANNDYGFSNSGNYTSLLNVSGNIEYSENSAVGGVVGLNDAESEAISGLISNVESNARISLNSMDNVGGIIGFNKFISQDNKFEINLASQMINSITLKENQVVNYSVKESKSTAIISAGNNVGGIVGNDTYGLYVDCRFQILSDQVYSYGIQGNSYVGGFVGNSINGKFKNCSVYSYKWDYSNLLDSTFVRYEVGEVTEDNYNTLKLKGLLYKYDATTNSFTKDNLPSTIFNNAETYYKMRDFDIVGNSFASGFAGCINKENNNISGVVCNSSVNAKINNKNNVNSYGLVGSGKHYGLNAYFNGFVNGLHDMSSGADIISNNASAWNKYYSNFIFINSNNYSLRYEGRIGNTPKSNRYDSVINPNFEKFNDGDLGEGDWIIISNINGSMPVVKYTSTQTIYELAPQELTATVKECDTTISNQYKRVDDASVVLFYYNPTTSLDYSTSNKLNNRYNIINLLAVEGLNAGLLELSTEPSRLGHVRLLAEIINGNGIVEIVGNVLVVKGTGECKLKISSILNPNAYTKITLVVINPLGNMAVANINSQTSVLEIHSGESEQYLLTASSSVSIDETETVPVAVDSAFYLEISITGENVGDYLTLYGLTKLDSSNCEIEDNKYTYRTNTKRNSIIIKALDQADKQYQVEVKPFITVGGTIIYLLNTPIQFNVKTLKGPTDVYLTYDYAIVYPNDETTITANITTDYVINDDSEILGFVKNILINNEITESVSITKLSSSFDPDKKLQKIVYKFSSNLSANVLDEKQILTVNFKVGDVESGVDFTLLKQKIDTIDVKNYIYKDDKYVVEDVLKPSEATEQNPGIVSIDMIPINAYYDYIEITDLTTGEEISFNQVDVDTSASPWALTPRANSEVSRDGKGIRLTKSASSSTVYARTQIDSRYSSRTHTLQITCLVEDGNGNLHEVAQTTKDIEVKMLPRIEVQYILPNGTQQRFMNEDVDTLDYLANGTTANFIIETYNSDGIVLTNITGIDNYYELVNDYGHFYSLVCKDYDASKSGETIKIEFSTTAQMDNGDYSVAKTSITFKLMDFVVHGISVNQSRTNSNNEKEIYGSYDVDYLLEFYFDTTDISVYDNGTFNKTVYRVGDINTNAFLNPIYNILKDINNTLEQGQTRVTETEIVCDPTTAEKTANLTNKNVLNVGKPKDEIEQNLKVKFKVSENEKVWVIQESSDAYVTYNLNFHDVMSFTEYDLIATEEQFINMSSGDINYILGADLVLENYSPIDISINEFDGNGHTITIKSFASFNEETIMAGLFKQIPAGMVVKNVNVVYETDFNNERSEFSFGYLSSKTFGDLCNNENVNYTSAYFGGITPQNYGIITNCQVDGDLCLKVGTIQELSTSGDINFYLGGLVCVNNSDSYITNSISNVKIYALGNIGGFVYQNYGKISSSSFGIDSNIASSLGMNSKAYINNFVDSTKQISVEAAGFAVQNYGKIYMSYVDLTANNSSISAKNASAGFVSRNSGRIEDSYCKIGEDNIGEHGNIFSGFVNTNSGTISTSYSYLLNVSNNVSAFAPDNTGLVNCLQFIRYGDEIYDSKLQSVLYGADIKTKFEKHGFVFGSNDSGVWQTTIGSKTINSIPILTSTLINPRYTSALANTESLYRGLRNIEVEIKEEVVDGELVKRTIYKVKDNTYGIKNNPITIHSADYWNAYILEGTDSYYRLIADIDFNSSTPLTSQLEFKGYLEGNAMNVENYILYSNESLSGIGLFRQVSANNNYNNHYIKNLNLKSRSVWASKTKAVGMLAGVIDGYSIYNINLDSANQIIVGGNAVGGLAGIVCGRFDVEKISSSVSVNSTGKATIEYSIYVSKLNNSKFAENLGDVYYAGSVVGILDGFAQSLSVIDVSKSRDISTYQKIQNISVSGDINVLGDSVGVAFGFVGENVFVNNVSVEITAGKVLGNQYSAGLVGENRGAINNAKVIIGEDVVFTQGTTPRVTAGLCGLNLGGLIQNSTVQAVIINSVNNATVGGIVGRNIYGNINNVEFDGQLFGYYTGVIVGSNYSSSILKRASLSKGALTASVRSLNNLIPSKEVEYYNYNVSIKNFENLTISGDTISYFVQNIKRFYYFNDEREGFNESLVKSRVLGLFVGLTDLETEINCRFENGSLISCNDSQEKQKVKVYISDGNITTSSTEKEIEINDVVVFDSFDSTNILFVIGANVSYMDIWNKDYSSNKIILTNSSISVIGE